MQMLDNVIQFFSDPEIATAVGRKQARNLVESAECVNKTLQEQRDSKLREVRDLLNHCHTVLSDMDVDGQAILSLEDTLRRV